MGRKRGKRYRPPLSKKEKIYNLNQLGKILNQTQVI
jgi:hypothetical protein